VLAGNLGYNGFIMELPKEQVEWVAKLAQIELTDTEKQKFAADLSNTITYIDELASVDVSGISDAVSNNSQITGLTNVTASDIVEDCELARDEFLKRAPMSEREFIKVKKVL
jgi:aspartyl-tRNA(Asn)/glutamyl-tRNA(Gln) amidotransferase subunit C